jgi:hypothetical protein
VVQVVLDRLNDARECLDVTVESQPRDRNEYLIVSRLLTTPNVEIIIIDDVKLAHHCLPKAASVGVRNKAARRARCHPGSISPSRVCQSHSQAEWPDLDLRVAGSGQYPNLDDPPSRSARGPVMNDEDWWRLAFDTENKRLYVEHEWAHLDVRGRGAANSGTEQIEIQ